MPRRILIIADQVDSPVGWGRYANDLINEFNHKGIEMDVICRNTAEHPIPVNNQLALLPDPLNFAANYLLWWYPLLKALTGHYKQLVACDVIHCFVESYAPFTQVLAWLLGKPYYITAHGSFGLKAFISPLYRIEQKCAYKHARRIICVSEYVKTSIEQHVSLKNLVVIPNGVGPDYFLPSPSNLREEMRVVGVGAVKRRKGFHCAIQAIGKLVQEFPGLQYHIIGDTSDRTYVASLKKIITELGLEHHVIFEGVLKDPAELREQYWKANLFLLTPESSSYSFEGFGLVYLEANACGLPVVGMAGSGAVQAIKEGYNGLVAREGDIDDIAQKIKAVLSDKNLHARLSQQGVAWAAEHGWSNIAEQYLKEYQQTAHT